MSHPVSLQRRLVDRYAVDRLDLGWNLRTVRTGLVRRRVEASDPASLVDVSVAGAAVLAPVDADLVPGRAVVVDVDGHRGVVRICNVRPSTDPDRSVYGIEFTDLSPGLRSRLVAPIQALRRHVPTREWTGD